MSSCSSRVGCLEHAPADEIVIDLADDDEFERELAHMQARFDIPHRNNSPPIEIDDDDDDDDDRSIGISGVNDISPSESSSTALEPVPEQLPVRATTANTTSADYDGELDEEVRHASRGQGVGDDDDNSLRDRTIGRPSKGPQIHDVAPANAAA